jgi:hypothetical protein
VTELQHLRLPAGDLRKYASSLDSQAHTPTVPMDTVVGWLKEANVPEAELAERALVHIPLFTCKYIYKGQTTRRWWRTGWCYPTSSSQK